MTTYNTGNPIGSTDARDRLDNSENMDILENSTTLNEHPDRLGTMRKTRKGMEDEHDAQIAAHETEHDNQMQSFENDFDSRLAGMAFTRIGTFTTGATLTDMRQTLLWEVSQGGDGHEYGWTGSFLPAGKVVAAGSTPATSGGVGAGAWVDRTDVTLRGDLESTTREAIRRSYAEAGFNLVDGSFEEGGTLTSSSDVLLHKASGIAYSGPIGSVAVGTDPTAVGSGYVPRTDVVLRINLAGDGGAALIGSASGETAQEIFDYVLPLRSNELSASSIARAIANGTAQKCACYGDSTMFGYKVGMPLPTDQVATPPTAAFQSMMGELQLPLTIYNRAISSTTLQSMIDGTDGSGSTFAAKVNVGGVDHDANIVYCNHAINDAKANSDVKVYRENLIIFITLCRKNGIVPVLVTPNPNPPIYSMTEENSRRLVFFAETMRAVAREYTVDLVDQYSYFDKSQKVKSMVEMVPDGIHPSDSMYVRAGKNLAIPVLSPLVVDGSQSNVKGLTGGSYKDNLTGRTMQGLGGRVGLTLTATRGTQPQALHIPVLFDDAANAFSVYGSESAGEDKVNVQLNGFTVGAFTDTKTLGDTAYVDNDYRYMVKVGVHAGLQLITLIYDSTAAPGNRFTFSGISLAPDQFQQLTGNTAGSASKFIPISSGYAALTMARLDATNELVFTDRNNSPVVKIKNVSNVFTVELVANGSVVSTHTSTAFFSDDSYVVEMVLSDSNIAISAGITGVYIPLTRKLPALFLYTKALNCYVI